MTTTVLAELREMLAELIDERGWLEDHCLILPGDGTAADLRRHFAAVIRTDGVEEALRQAQAHYRAAVQECRVLPLADAAGNPEIDNHGIPDHQRPNKLTKR